MQATYKVTDAKPYFHVVEGGNNKYTTFNSITSTPKRMIFYAIDSTSFQSLARTLYTLTYFIANFFSFNKIFYTHFTFKWRCICSFFSICSMGNCGTSYGAEISFGNGSPSISCPVIDTPGDSLPIYEWTEQNKIIYIKYEWTNEEKKTYQSSSIYQLCFFPCWRRRKL